MKTNPSTTTPEPIRWGCLSSHSRLEAVTSPAPPSLNGVPPAVAPGPRDITVSALWELYVQERKPPPKTLSEFGTHLRRFREVNGDLPLRAVTKAHVRDFKDAMLKMPARMKAPLRKLTVPQLLERFANDTDTPRLSLASINSRALGAVSAVFGYAADNGSRCIRPPNAFVTDEVR